MNFTNNGPTLPIVRMFVSSTFRDMQAERNVLVSRVFPQVRRWCEQRGVIWREVDLRWGITAEESQQIGTVELCLEEVDHCRPFFMGLLGARYGHVEWELRPSLLKRYPWIAGYRGRSITELEILHGVLNSEAEPGMALFYLREVSESEASAESETHREHLEALKRRIIDSGQIVRQYSSLEELTGFMEVDLRAMVERTFPAELANGGGSASRSLAKLRGSFYVGSESWFHRLERHARNGRRPLLVTGGVGSGKTALLSAWSLWRLGANGEIHLKPASLFERTLARIHHQSGKRAKLVMWLVGASGEREDWSMIARGIVRMLDPGAGPEPTDLLALRSRLARSLRVKESTVLVIDGIDQIRGFDPAAPFSWLPERLPKHLHLILSASAPEAVAEARQRGWTALTLPPLSLDDRRNFAVAWLRTFRKNLTTHQQSQICAIPQGSNPLFLRVLLDDLRVFGSFSGLDSEIVACARLEGMQELYERLIVRIEQTCNVDRTREFFGLLAASRQGLTETELAALLHSRESPLPAAMLSPLLLAAGESLSGNGGRLRIERAEFSEAILARYGSPAKFHAKLARFFEADRWGARKVVELPWHLAALDRWEDLAALLADTAFLGADGGFTEARRAWSWLRDERGISPTVVYQEVLANPTAHTEACCVVAELLSELGNASEALKLSEHLLAKNRAENDFQALARALELHGGLLQQAGDPYSAIPVWTELRQIAKELGEPALRARALSSEGAALRKLGRDCDALNAWREEQKICISMGDEVALATCLGNQAIILSTTDPERARRLFFEQETACRLLDDIDGLRRSLGNQGALWLSRNRAAAALPLFREEELICRRFHDDRGLLVCLGNQAEASKQLGDYDSALEFLEERTKICHLLADREGEARTLLQQADLWGVKLGAVGEASRFLEAAFVLATEHEIGEVVKEVQILRQNLGL